MRGSHVVRRRASCVAYVYAACVCAVCVVRGRDPAPTHACARVKRVHGPRLRGPRCARVSTPHWASTNGRIRVGCINPRRTRRRCDGVRDPRRTRRWSETCATQNAAGSETRAELRCPNLNATHAERAHPRRTREHPCRTRARRACVELRNPRPTHQSGHWWNRVTPGGTGRR